MYHADVGHVYNRAYKQTYISTVFEWDQPRRKGTINCDAITPNQSRLAVAIRSAPTSKLLQDKPWIDLPDKSFSVVTTDRYLQYRLTLISKNGDSYPIVDKVQLKITQ
jgi:hypothetical protein